jgi:hypothetical protein
MIESVMRGVSLSIWRRKLLTQSGHYRYTDHHSRTIGGSAEERRGQSCRLSEPYAVAEAGTYSVMEALYDGRRVEIRAR